MHQNKGKTIAQCLKDRTDYAINPDKTENGDLVSAYACDPHTADAEFAFSKRQYKAITGREQQNDVIAYQVRQSFKPGEITPEEANRVGYEFASRFLKGKHAFIVATHTDKKHIHNHIIWNSTTIDCTHKFRDFFCSGRAVARLSDTICMEHQLSVIQNPRRHSKSSYNLWLGDQAKPPHREILRTEIDAALAKKPQTFEAFLVLMEAAGYSIKCGKHLTFCKTGQKNIRLSSLGDGYTEAELRLVIAGEKPHTPKKKRSPTVPQKSSLLIDIQKKMNAGKGAGYARWAAKFNLKQMAKTVLYIQEHGISNYQELAVRADDAAARFNTLTAQVKAAETRMTEVAVLKTHIINYAKTKKVFDGYKNARYSKKYLAEHEADIIIHRASKKAFNNLGLKKLPTVKALSCEYGKLLAEKKEAYAQLHDAQEQMRELLIHRENLRQILDIPEPEKQKENEHGRE